MLRYSLSELNTLLPDGFIQVHRSYIVNKEEVAYIGGNYVKIKDEKIPISLQRKEEIIKTFTFL